MNKNADIETETDYKLDLEFESKIKRSDWAKGNGPIDAVKGFIRTEPRSMSQKNYKRTIGASGTEPMSLHHKARSTGGSIDTSFNFRTLHSRGPSVDLTSQLTTRRMYGNPLSRAATISLNENLEKLQKEFPVLPYYKDESKTTIAIPPNLQVKESIWTLKYHSTKKDVNSEPNVNTVDEGPLELEKSFVQQRFYKSRRLVRICIIILILFILFSAAVDDCNFLEKFLKEATANSMCTQEYQSMKQRKIIFCAVECPLLFIWFLATFSKFYEENLTWLPSIFVFTVAGFLLATTYIGKNPDSAIYMSYLFMVWLFIRIPFWNAFLVTSIMFVIYVSVMRYTELYSRMESVDDPTSIELVELLYLFTTNICLMYAAYFWERSDRVEYLESKVLKHVRKNSKNLINQILPIAVQERIQKSFLAKGSVDEQKPIADKNDNVSVLFSDIKGFTKFCSSVQAVDVVRALNTLYMSFDESLEKLGVFKVETIGDAYFVSANCPIEKPDHARRLVILGKEMIETCTRFKPVKNKDYKFQMRIGVHSGTVCAGIVGRKMPRYHLFGQTVTIAECMESSGEPGRVQISEATLKYLRDWEKESKRKLDFSFEFRREQEVIPSKFMKTYLVEFRSRLKAANRL